MRVAILTNYQFGSASRCLPALLARQGVEVVGVLRGLGQVKSRWARMQRDLRKIQRIGVAGALIGLRMRRWNVGPDEGDLDAIARGAGIPVETTARLNDVHAKEVLRRWAPDLGLILGAGIIRADVLEIPRLGMVNVHGEILPDFRGATSVIWAIHEGRTETGFTIHRVDPGIDTGDILHVERMPIEFRPTLRETYQHNVPRLQSPISERLAQVVADFEKALATARKQGTGRTFTTPNWSQYRRMVSENRRLYQAQIVNQPASGTDGSRVDRSIP